MALTFPSVLGTVIYSLLDTGMRESFHKVLVVLRLLNSQDVVARESQLPLLSALGLRPKWGLTVYLLITLLVAVQYSCDYLYSKYFEKQYLFQHFVYDIIISTALGVSFLGFSAGVRGGIGLLQISFGVLWAGFIVSYLTYLVWDLRAWCAQGKDQHWGPFFQGMVVFEIICLVANIGLLALTKRIDDSFTIACVYIPICLVVMTCLSIWFVRKIWVLEILTRGDSAETAVNSGAAMKTSPE